MRNFTQQPIGTLSTDTPERATRYLGLPRHEAQARITESKHLVAERAAIQRRQDKDRIVQAALDTLEVCAIDNGISTGIPRAGLANYIAGAADIPIAERGHTVENRVAYILELLADIRAELSPVVTGRIADNGN